MRSDREDFLFQILINECLVEFAGFGGKGLAEAIKEAVKKEEINFKNDLGLNLIEQPNPLDAHERAMRQMQITLRRGIYLDKLDIADIFTFLQLCGRFFNSKQTDKFNQILQDIQNKKSDENGGGANTPEMDAKKDVNEKLLNLAEELLKSADEARREYSEKFDSDVIKNYKKKIYAGIRMNLKKINDIQDFLTEFGFDKSETEYLSWGLSTGSSFSWWLEHFKKYLKHIKNDAKLKEICDKIGRIDGKKDKFKDADRFEKTKIRRNQKEEIDGIKLGSDIDNLLPSELGLTDMDTQILFDIKFVENKLTCFESFSTEQIKISDKILYNADTKGPIILCVDFSGSMSGIPETVAKVVTKMIADIARVEGRLCYVLGFDTRVIKIDLNGKEGLKNLAKFCYKGYSGGGTDLTPAVREALKLIKKGGYANADILTISDMVFPVTDEIKNITKEIKKGGSKIYALIIADDKFEPDGIFDAAWQRKNREKANIFEVRCEK